MKRQSLLLRGLAASLLSVTLLSGCSWLVKIVGAPNVDESDQLNLFDPDQYEDCMASDLPSCPGTGANLTTKAEPLNTDLAAELDLQRLAAGFSDERLSRLAESSQPAVRALSHPVQGQINRLFNLGVGVSDIGARDDEKAAGPVLDFTVSEFEDYASAIETATGTNSWEALAELVDQPEARVDEQKSRAVKFLKAYFEAYFRYGEFIAIQIDATTIKEQVVQKLMSSMPELSQEEATEIADELLEAAKFDDDAWRIGRISPTGLVTRGGQTLQFPAIQVTYTLPSPRPELPDVDFVIVGSDLIRVALHAIFDSYLNVPGVSAATGVLLEDGLPDFDKQPGEFGVTQAEFGKVESRSAQVEAVTGALVGRLVRGLGIVSLNNEALATLFETGLAITLRKPAERLMWCHYACTGNEDAREDQPQGFYPPTREVTISISGFVSTESELQAEATRR